MPAVSSSGYAMRVTLLTWWAVLNALSALDALQTETYDAAIIDLGLPQMDGLTLIRSIRQSG